MRFLRFSAIVAVVLSAALHGALATHDPYLQKRAAMVRDQIERAEEEQFSTDNCRKSQIGHIDEPNLVIQSILVK